MKISFCTPCAQRLYQLEQTWDANIQSISKNSNIEWILLNYDNDERMHNFVMFKKENWPINFTYAKSLDKNKWHMSVAKNMAHQLGSGEVLFNLDCDNFIADAPQIITEHFSSNVKMLHHCSNVPQDGTSGRIAIDKKLFYDVGGYDESFLPMAGQDTDLIARCKKIGVQILTIQGSSSHAIKNTKIESMKLCQEYNLTWEEFSIENRKKIKENLKKNILIANCPTGMTKPNVEIFRGVVA
jgi:hypothetical protein